MESKQVSFYLCPTVGCDNYYGAASMGDLAKAENIESAMRHNEHSRPASDPVVMSHRADCPSCRANGLGVVKRRLVTMRILWEPTEDDFLFIGASRVRTPEEIARQQALVKDHPGGIV
jgi:hypothetical protein